MTGIEASTRTDGDAVDIDRYPRQLLLTCIGALVVFSSSMTIVSASLPVMAEDLGSTESVLSWAVTGLFLSMAVATPVMGRLGDAHGHRRVFLIGAAIMAVGTVACAVAPTAGAFIAARMVVGLGIATTMPNAMALIMSVWPEERRSVAMGWFQMAMTGAPVVGLVVGGPLIEAFGWRAVFVVLSPISFGAFAVAWRVVRPNVAAHAVPVDWWGAASLATGTLGFLLALERGRAVGFSDPSTLALVATSVLGITAFVAVERRVEHPMVALRYFRRPTFTGALVAQAFAQFAYMGGFLITPLLLDSVFGYTVSAIALVLLFRPGVYSLMSPIGGRAAVRFGGRTMILIGSVGISVSMAMVAVAAGRSSLPWLIAGLVLSGAAIGVASPSYATVVVGAVDARDMGVASGMNATFMNIGMLTGIQVLFVVLGDGRTPRDFAEVYVVGGAVSLVGILGALAIGRDGRAGPPARPS